jgi:hypothetical protein
MSKRAVCGEVAPVDWLSLPQELWREIFSHCELRDFIWPLSRLWKTLLSLERERINDLFIKELQEFSSLAPECPTYELDFVSYDDAERLVGRIMLGDTMGYVECICKEIVALYCPATTHTVLALYRELCRIRNLDGITEDVNCKVDLRLRGQLGTHYILIARPTEDTDVLFPYSHFRHLLNGIFNENITSGTSAWNARFCGINMKKSSPLTEVAASVKRPVLIPQSYAWQPGDLVESDVRIFHSLSPPSTVLKYLNAPPSPGLLPMLRSAIHRLLSHLSLLRDK